LKKRTVILAVILLGAVGIAVVVFWRLGWQDGPGRKLVGRWEILDSRFEDVMREAIEKEAPKVAWAAEGKFRSTERIELDGNGRWHHAQEMVGVTIAEEGTWQATATSDNTLSVKFHKTKLSVRDPKGEVKEEPQDTVFEWVITVVGPDQLSGSVTSDDGKPQRFAMRRATD
jgi:hypothetical protein